MILGDQLRARAIVAGGRAGCRAGACSAGQPCVTGAHVDGRVLHAGALCSAVPDAHSTFVARCHDNVDPAEKLVEINVGLLLADMGLGVVGVEGDGGEVRGGYREGDHVDGPELDRRG